MKGYRFYEELKNKNRKGEESEGNVLALLLQEDGRGWSPIRYGRDKMCCVSAVFFHPNSAVASGGVTYSYLEHGCRRISEKRAREIHPNLFEYLETD